MTTSHLIIVAPEELEAGFRLAGVDVRTAADGAAAAGEVGRLVAEGERGVIGVYEPFFTQFDARLRERLQQSVVPVVIAVPSGFAEVSGEARRARIAALLTRAVGYHITFGEDVE